MDLNPDEAGKSKSNQSGREQRLMDLYAFIMRGLMRHDMLLACKDDMAYMERVARRERLVWEMAYRLLNDEEKLSEKSNISLTINGCPLPPPFELAVRNAF